MANTRDIPRRIKSIKNTAQITRAMQLVAASKMKRAQESALSSRPYAALLSEILSALATHLTDLKHPFLEQREVQHRGILIISTDKGLCGPLNSNLFRLVTEIDKSARYVSLGRKGTQFLSRSQRDLIADLSVSDRVRFAEVRPAMEFMIKNYNEGKIDTIEVLFSRFLNTLVQQPTLVPLLPLHDLKELLVKRAKESGEATIVEDSREIHFEPDPETILHDLLSLYLKQQIYQMVLEAKASEHSARMVAMKTATDNAKTLIDEITLEYNKVRQAAITQEILEISAAGFTTA